MPCLWLRAVHTYAHTFILSLVQSVITSCPLNTTFCSINLLADSWSHPDWWAPNLCEEPRQWWKRLSHQHGRGRWLRSRTSFITTLWYTWNIKNRYSCRRSKMCCTPIGFFKVVWKCIQYKQNGNYVFHFGYLIDLRCFYHLKQIKTFEVGVVDVFNTKVVQRDLKRQWDWAFPTLCFWKALFFFFESVSVLCGRSLSSAQWQRGTNQRFLLTRQIHTLSHPIFPKLQRPTSGVTSLGKQCCRQSHPLMRFISHYYWLAWPLAALEIRELSK